MTNQQAANLPGQPDPKAFCRLPSQPLVDSETAATYRAARARTHNINASQQTISIAIEGVPSIVELARALKNDVDLIFQFVHDNIEFYPNYGLHKGGWGALVDGFGNAFDQSDLMVQLLVQSGYTASYVMGNIELSAAQWSNWLNVATTELAFAAQLIADGGFSVGVNTTANTITLDYCWVQCNISGTNYQFDPALKNYNYTSGINLASAMSYSQSTFLNDATSLSTITANSAQNINQPNISQDLSLYATNLAAWIETNNPGATFEQIVGGRNIVPVSGPIRQTSLPYVSGTPSVVSSLPTSVMATFQVQFGSINQTFYTKDIYGYRMSIFWNSSHQAQLYVNLPGTSGNIVATSTAQIIGTSYPLVLTVTHPYSSNFADGAGTVNVTAGSYCAIGTAWGYAGRQMAEVHRAALKQSINAGVATDAENMIGASLSITWWNFSGQNSSGTQIINQLSSCFSTFHHNVGIVVFFPSSVFTPGNYLGINFFNNNWSTTPLSPNTNSNAASAHVSLLWHLLESAIITQTPGVECGSATTLITSANGGSCTATVGGTVAVGEVLNIFVHDSRLAVNPTQISYTVVSGDTTTKIASNLASAINSNSQLAVIGVTATSATNVLRIQSFSYNNTTFTQSTTGAVTLTLAPAQGRIIYGGNKTNWSAVLEPALAAAGYTSAELQSLGYFLSSKASATITGTVSGGGGDVLNLFVYDSGLSTNPTQISYTTIAGDTTTSIATKLATAINSSSALSGLGITAASSANVVALYSLSANTTTYTQSVTSGSEIITVTNFAFASIAGPVATGGGDVLNVFIHDAGLTINPTQISYTTVAGDTPATIAFHLADLINNNAALTAIGVSALNEGFISTNANILILQSESSNNTTYTASVTSGSETITLFYDGGYTAFIPDTPDVYIGDYFFGYGYFLLRFDGAVFFGPLVDTGKGAKSGTISDSQCNDGCANNSADVNGTGVAGASSNVSAEPIDLFKGRYLYTSVDLSVGNQSSPYELAFIRTYNSGNFTNNAGLGYGWNHNYQISATTNSDGFIGFGSQSVTAAVAAIAEMYVCQDLLEATSPALTVQSAVIITVSNQWLATQLANNTVLVQFGSNNQVFARLPNGTYTPPLGVKSATTLSLNGTYEYTTANKVVYSFNSSGQVSSITYPFGITINCNYTSGLLTSITNGFRTLTLAYTSGNISSVTDGNGRTVHYTISSNNLTSATNVLSNSTTYSYSSAGLISQIFMPANPSSAVVSNMYDSLNRIKSQTDAYGNTWNYFVAGSRSEEENPNGDSRVWYFNPFGNALSYVNALGNEIVSQFDGRTRVTLVTLPEGNSTAYTYDSLDNVLSVTKHPKPSSGLADITNSFTYDPIWNQLQGWTDGNGNLTSFTYSSSSGRLTQIQYPAVSAGTPLATFSYNSLGQLTLAIDPTGIQTAYAFDPTNHSLLSRTVDAATSGLNLTTNLTVDAVGNIATVTDPNGSITTFSYDAARRLTQKNDPAPFSYITTLSYDANNNLTTVQRQTDNNIPQTYTSTFGIDNLLQASSEPAINWWGQQPNPTTYTYDNLRRLQMFTDSLGDQYGYIYDAESHVVQIDYPDGMGSLYRSYTDNGYIASVTDMLTHATTYDYDGFDRVSQVTYADASSETTTYDANNNLTQVITRAGATISYVYDALNQRTTKTPQSMPTVTYSYDLAGRVLSAAVPVVAGDPSTGVFSLSYDSAGRFIKEQYPDGKSVLLGLDPNSNATSITYPDASVVSRSYDQLNRLLGVSHGIIAATLIYDALSRRIGQSYSNGVGTGLRYDQANNLISLAIAPPLALQLTYTYNQNHQIVSKHASDSSYLWQPAILLTDSYATASAVNQYPSVNSVGYSYDGNGCLTNDGTMTYSFDTENRLIAASAAGLTAVYKYDPFGRQRQKIVNGVSTTFFYLGMQRLVDYDATGAVMFKYAYGASLDEPLWAEDGSGTVSYIHTDEIGSVLFLTDSTGNVINKNPYSPSGQSSNVNSTNFAFTGQRFDPETGLYFFKSRHYAPSIGRFLQPDPIGYASGDLNVYTYVTNDPLNFCDSLGLSPAPDEDPTTGALNGDPNKVYELGASKFQFFDESFNQNSSFLNDFLSGAGQTNRVYNLGTREFRDVVNSRGAARLRNAFYSGHLKNIPAGEKGFHYGTVEAFLDTLVLPQTANWNSTNAQLGGWVGSAVYNSASSTVTFTVQNEAGTNSFFGLTRLIPWLNWNVPNNLFGSQKGKPLRTITQTFVWTENIDTSLIESIRIRERNERLNREAGYSE